MPSRFRVTLCARSRQRGRPPPNPTLPNHCSGVNIPDDISNDPLKYEAFLRAKYDEEKRELVRLEDYFNKLLAEREARAAEERKRAEEMQRQQAQQATLNKAATMLQKVLR